MGWQLLSYAAILFLTSLLSVVVARLALRLRDKPGGLPLGLLMLAVAAWSFTLAFEATAATIPAKVLWSKFEYLGITSVPVLLWLFALEYTHREKWLKRRYMILYWIIPLVSLTLAFTNEWHLMIWTSFTPIPGSNLIIYGHGTWFWIMVTYDYLVLSTATVLLLEAAFRFRHVYRRQAIILLVGMFPPWLANILYVFDLGPPGWDLTPVGFALTGLLLTWSLARLQLLDLAPVARDKVIESMRDGMLVLDAQNRIVDINPAAQKLIGVDGESAIGQHAEAILAQWTSLEDRYRGAMEAQGQVFVAGVGYIEWRTFPLPGRGGRPGGQLIILRDVTERKRAEEKVKRRGEELEALREISLAITAQLELDELLRSVVEQGCRLLEVETGVIYLIDETQGDLQLVVSHGYTRDYTGTRLAPGEGLSGKVLQSGEPLAVDDYHHWEGRSPDWEAEPLTAVLGVPLKRGEQVIGVLDFGEMARTRSFDEHDVRLATLFAGQAAIAIENARLYQAEQAAHERADTLRETSRIVGSTLELDDVLSLVLRQTKRVLTYDTASILLFAGGEPAMAAVSGYEDEGLVKTEVFWRLNDSPILQAMSGDHCPVVIADVREDERWIWVPGAEDIRSWIGAPLLVRDEMVGALMIDSTQPGFYTAADAAITQALANQAAVAIENARLYQESHDRAEEQKGLARIAALASSTLEIDELIEQIMGETMRMLGSRGGMLLLLDEEQGALTARYLKDPYLTEKIKASWRIPIDVPGFENSLFAQGSSYFCNDVEGDPNIIPAYRPHIQVLGIRNFAGVALRLKDRSIGELYVGGRPADFGPEDTRLLRTIAGYVANAIENARLYEQAQQRLESLTNLNRASRAIASSLDVKDVLEQIVELAEPVVNSDYTSVVLLDEEGEPVLAFGSLHRVPRVAEGIRSSGVTRYVLDSGQPVVVDTVSDEGAMSPPLRQPDGELMKANPTVVAAGIRSFAAVPIQAGERMLGVLFVHGRQPHTFHGRVSLLTTFANQAAVAIENARLFEEIREHVARLEKTTRDLELIHQVSQVVSSSLDLTNILETTVEQMVAVFDVDHSGILLFDQTQTYGWVVAEHPSTGATAERFPVQGYLAAERIIADREPLVIEDVWNDPLMATVREAMHRLDIRSMLIVPLIVKGEVVGSIGLDAVGRQRRFNAEEVALAQTIANQAAMAIENARLYDETHQRTAQLEALREMGLELTAELNLDDLLHSIVSRAIDLVGGTKGGLDFYRPDRDVLEFAVHIGIDPMPSKTIFQRGEGLSGTVWESSKALIVNDYQRWEGRAALWDEYLGRSAIVGVPIHWGDEFLGVLEVMADPPRTFSQADADLLSLFATQAAIAIENARLFEAEQRRRQEAETLRQTALALTTSLDRNQVVERILIQLRQVVPYDSASVQLLKGDRLEIVGGHGFPNLPDLLGLSFSVDGDNPNTEVIRTQAIFIVADGPAVYEGFRREPHAQAGIRSWLGAPMLVGEQLVGMIALDKQEPGFYTEEHGQLALAFAAQAAIAIENARLYEQAQQEIAERKRAQEALDQKLIVLTQPVGEVGELKLTDIIDVKILQELQDRFAASYDVASLIFDGQGTPITAPSNFSDFCGIVRATRQGLERCEISDASLSRLVAGGSPATAVCRNFEEILDGAVPILVGDKHIATWGIGQKVISELSEDKVRSYAEKIGADADQLVAAGKKLELGSKEQFERAISFLETVASNISLLGLQNIQQAREITERQRAERALRRRATQLATVGEVGRQITSLLELDPLLDHIVNLIRQAFGYYYVSIFLVDPATGELSLRAGAGFELEPAKALHLKVGQDGICGWVAASGEPLLVDDVSQEPRYRLVEALADTRSELTVPIQVRDQVIGVLDVRSAALDGFDTDDLSTLQTLADQVSVALENAWLFEAEREQRELAEALEEAAAAVSSTLHLDQVLDRILEQVERVVPGDVFNVMLIEGDTARLVRCRGHKQPDMDDQISRLAITIAEYPSLVKMARTGKPVVIPDTAADPNWVPSKSQDSPRSYVAAPIRVAGLTVGFLNASGAHPGQFGPADARRLEAFADHAATSIENARLYRELLDHAEQLEQRVWERTAQFQAQYARLDTILRSTTDGIVVTDARGEIVQTNPVSQAWLTQTLSPEDGARLRGAIRDLVRRAEAQPEMVLELTGLDLELRAAPVAEPGMEEAAAVVDIHDVSHLKAMDRVKSRFVSNVSHELRTPITTIKLYAHLMQRTPPESEKWGQYLNALAQEADRQARLVENILQISRIDTGRLEMKPRPTSLNELTDAVTISHQVLAQDRGLTLEHRPAEPGPVALVDPERMMQVLNNLVRNSIHYTPEGGRVVVATGKAETGGRVWATVTVADTGMGIPEEELPHVFERFFRGEKPRMMQISGTGLGLAITREIVELHGGRVTVESPSTLRRGFPRLCSGQAGQTALKAGEEGVGSTFTVWLPITD